jgi:hypothetical protein
MLGVRRRMLYCFALGLCVAASYLGLRYLCVSNLEIPVFASGALAGDAREIYKALGEPEEIRLASKSELSADRTLADLLPSEEVHRLPDATYRVLQWRKRCLRVVVWRFAVVAEQETWRIVLFGGESRFKVPLYLGGH